jgi:hypothetical protein
VCVCVCITVTRQVHHVVRISGAWVPWANVPAYQLTTPETDSIQWGKLVETKCRPSHGTQIHVESGENRLSSRWRRETLLATAATVCHVGGISQKILANFSHESGYSYSTCQKAAKKEKRRTWWVRKTHFVGTKQAKTSSLLPTMSPLEFAGNTCHRIIYGRNLVPSLCLSHSVEQLDDVVTSGNIVQHATWQENPW